MGVSGRQQVFQVVRGLPLLLRGLANWAVNSDPLTNNFPPPRADAFNHASNAKWPLSTQVRMVDVLMPYFFAASSDVTRPAGISS